MNSLTGSPQLVAAVQTAVALPVVLLALWAGAVVDRLDRRLVMQGAQFVMADCCPEGSCRRLVHSLVVVQSDFRLGCGIALNSPA